MLSSPVNITPAVLVVEDEVLIRIAISGYLRDCGYTVFEAANAGEARTILQKADLEIDLVLSDIEMPGSMDGFGLAQWVRKNRQGWMLFLLEPEGAADAAADLCEKGPMLAKPYEPQILVDRVKQLLATRARRGGR